MPVPIAVAAGSIAFLKGLSAFLRKKSKDKKEKEQHRATTAGLNLRQKQAEDARRARVRTGASLLGGVPATTAGGAVNTNVGLDPALVADLERERTYDFGSTLPRPGVGGTSEFLAGLFGDLGDVATRAFGAPETPGSATQILANSPLREAPGAGSIVTPPSGISRIPFEQVSGSLTIEDLLELGRQRGRGRPIPLSDEDV